MVKAIRGAWRKRRELRHRARLEDVLKHVLGRQSDGAGAGIDSLAGALDLSRQAASRLIAEMERAALLQSETDGLRLTADGEKWALQVVRAHRLWETYLADEARMPASQIHGPAEREEHRLIATEAVDALDAFLGHPRQDPHGAPIPTASGEIAVQPALPAEVPPDRASMTSLADLKTGEDAEVVLLDPELRGFTRRRLLDLGLTRNSRVTAHLANAFGDPLAFRVRGTTIAIRKEEASKVRVRRMEERRA